jgi:hypothetical protein
MHPTTLSHLVAQHTADLHADAVEWRLVRHAKAPSGRRPIHERLQRMYRRPPRRHNAGPDKTAISASVATT